MTGWAHVTVLRRGPPNGIKMAATGDDAAAMDSISRAPAAHAAALSATSRGEGTEAAAESPVVVPKKLNTNSK